MISQYKEGYPKRIFTHHRIIISDLTKARTKYDNLIRVFCELLSCRALRDTRGFFRDHIYVVGRENSVKAFVYYFKKVVREIELKVELYRGLCERTDTHKSTKVANYRIELIKQVIEEVQTILSLKEEFYYKQYAPLRKVYSNEIADKTFFVEYIKENRLTHLKLYYATSSVSDSTRKAD
jgi:hypothetical protein